MVPPFGAYHGFLDRGLLQIGKLLKQGFPVHFQTEFSGKVEERLNKFAVSEMGSLFWFNNNTILKSVY
jgi:hypothetical protein